MRDLFIKYKYYIALYLVFFAIHLILPLDWGDDKVFLIKAAETTISSFLQGSARPFTDAMTYLFSRCHFLWRVLNPAILTVLIAIVHKLTTCKENKIISLFVVFPTMCMVDAGFIATTVNYLWCITFGVLSLLPLREFYYGNRIKWYYCILLLPLLIFATNMQQMSIVLLAVLLLGNIYLLIKKNPYFYSLVQLLIVLAMTGYSYYINTFGENNRMLRETDRYFPSFQNLGVFEKLELGFSSTFYMMTAKLHFPIIAYLIFTGFISVMVFKRHKNKILKAISVIPPAVCLTVLFPADMQALIFGELQNFKVGKAFYSFEPIADLIFVLIAISFLVCVCSLTKEKWYCLIVLGLGLGSRMLMGFSPTVWASGCRTFSVMIITFVLVSLVVFEEYKTDKRTVKAVQVP